MAEYWEATLVAERNALEVWEVMLKAEQKTVKAIRAKNFEKYLSVAKLIRTTGMHSLMR